MATPFSFASHPQILQFTKPIVVYVSSLSSIPTTNTFVPALSSELQEYLTAFLSQYSLLS